MTITTPFGPSVQEVPLTRAPLVNVIAQVRFPAVMKIEDNAFVANFQEAIRKDYPILRPERQLGVMIGPGGVQPQDAGTVWRFETKDPDAWQVTLAPTLRVAVGQAVHAPQRPPCPADRRSPCARRLAAPERVRPDRGPVCGQSDGRPARAAWQRSSVPRCSAWPVTRRCSATSKWCTRYRTRSSSWTMRRSSADGGADFPPAPRTTLASNRHGSRRGCST